MGGLIPRDAEEDFISDVAKTADIVVFFRHAQMTPPAKDPNSWLPESLTNSFRPELNNRIADLLDSPIQVDEYCWVFPIKTR